MTKLQEKAQAQVKQMVGQMVGDDQLVQEGREQRQNADQAGPATNKDLKSEKEGRAPAADRGPKEKP